MDERFLQIYLVRHGESAANTGDHDPQLEGDYSTPLTPNGWKQSIEVGKKIGHEVFKDSLVYYSPYQRTIDTLEAMLEGAEVQKGELILNEDPRLREMDFGYGDVEAQRKKRPVHGWFFYRFEGGESPADCYDRTSSFLESMMREIERKDINKVIIVTHGGTIRCFVMRFLHLTVNDYDKMKNPLNTDIIKIQPTTKAAEGSEISNRGWTASGLRWYEEN